MRAFAFLLSSCAFEMALAVLSCYMSSVVLRTAGTSSTADSASTPVYITSVVLLMLLFTGVLSGHVTGEDHELVRRTCLLISACAIGVASMASLTGDHLRTGDTMLVVCCVLVVLASGARRWSRTAVGKETDNER